MPQKSRPLHRQLKLLHCTDCDAWQTLSLLMKVTCCQVAPRWVGEREARPPLQQVEQQVYQTRERGGSKALALKMARQMLWNVEKGMEGKMGVLVPDDPDNSHQVCNFVWADNYWIFSQKKENVERIMKDLVEEVERWDIEPICKGGERGDGDRNGGRNT